MLYSNTVAIKKLHISERVIDPFVLLLLFSLSYFSLPDCMEKFRCPDTQGSQHLIDLLTLFCFVARKARGWEWSPCKCFLHHTFFHCFMYLLGTSFLECICCSFQLVHCKYSCWCPSNLECCYPQLEQTNFHKLHDLKTTEIVLSRFWSPEVWNQDFSRAVLPPKALRKIPSFPLPVSGGSRCSLVYSHITPVSASIFTWPVMSLKFPCLSDKDTCH